MFTGLVLGQFSIIVGCSRDENNRREKQSQADAREIHGGRPRGSRICPLPQWVLWFPFLPGVAPLRGSTSGWDGWLPCPYPYPYPYPLALSSPAKSGALRGCNRRGSSLIPGLSDLSVAAMG